MKRKKGAVPEFSAWLRGKFKIRNLRSKKKMDEAYKKWLSLVHDELAPTSKEGGRVFKSLSIPEKWAKYITGKHPLEKKLRHEIANPRYPGFLETVFPKKYQGISEDKLSLPSIFAELIRKRPKAYEYAAFIVFHDFSPDIELRKGEFFKAYDDSMFGESMMDNATEAYEASEEEHYKSLAETHGAYGQDDLEENDKIDDILQSPQGGQQFHNELVSLIRRFEWAPTYKPSLEKGLPIWQKDNWKRVFDYFHEQVNNLGNAEPQESWSDHESPFLRSLAAKK